MPAAECQRTVHSCHKGSGSGCETKPKTIAEGQESAKVQNKSYRLPGMSSKGCLLYGTRWQSFHGSPVCVLAVLLVDPLGVL